MIWTVARRELADQLTSMRFLVVALLVVGLTPLAVYVSTRDYLNRLQNRVARAIMILSPAAMFADAAADLSQTGDAERKSWYSAINRHERALNRVLFEDPPTIAFRSRIGAVTVARRLPPTIAHLPVFVPPQSDAAPAVKAALQSLALLGLYAGLLTLAAFYPPATT